MDGLIKFMLEHKKTVVAAFLAAAAVCMLLSAQVKVNYNIIDYLPDEAPSTTALNVMESEYAKGTPNVRLMLKNVSVNDVLAIKDKIKEIDGVDDVTWLDDTANVYQPLEFIPKKTLDEYYDGANALITITVNIDKQVEAIDEIRAAAGESAALCGSAVDSVTAMQQTTKEIQKIMVFVVLLVFAVLILTTTSYLEPVLFLITIGVAIMLNNGTNIIFGEISFVTNAAGSILQLAVSMDYSIFLVHRFGEMRNEYDDPVEAMTMAVKKSFGSVMSSGLTTVMGFAALVIMKFKIGPDMGLVMAKAIAISLFSVMVFLPSATLLCYKYIDKTRHKLFIPPFEKFSKVVLKIKIPVLILFAVIIIPSFLAQQNNSFTYGSSGIYGSGTQLGDDTAEIEKIFGKSNVMALMVPKGNPSDEKAMCGELLENDCITSVVSLTEAAGVSMPEEFVPEDTLSQLVSDKYSRAIITIDADDEGKKAFEIVETVRKTAEKYYKSDYLLVGTTVNSYDMKNTVTLDNERVNILAILSIWLILLLNFKSLSIPLILLLVIESSIWINLSVPYFADETLFYIGYLIISSIQLGATVDYAILFADRYIENRRDMKASQAACKTLADTSLSILTSSSILMLAGFSMGIISTNGIISQLGILVGRGALLSCLLVMIVLPSLIRICDGMIYKTTLNLNFYGKKERKRKHAEM